MLKDFCLEPREYKHARTLKASVDSGGPED
ncbi:MAG: hypothetical protein UW72_C0005G0024 [Parcubacteria group bacterium GW2011_GWF2_44_7]|nr:MAG: hypothetical protein UW72_C0005G0024 [Parcubacteria group bacterium GW2011_GWF2_44_7]